MTVKAVAHESYHNHPQQISSVNLHSLFSRWPQTMPTEPPDPVVVVVKGSGLSFNLSSVHVNLLTLKKQLSKIVYVICPYRCLM